MKQWFVVQVYTGFEEVVKAELEKKIREGELSDYVDEVLIPTGRSLAFISGGEEKKEKIFPGYLLIHMERDPNAFRIIRSVPRVSRFLGGTDPMPLSNKEVDRIFSQISGEIPIGEEKSPFSVGGEVHITKGPFAGFVGIIDKIDEEREKLTVMVTIFGRLTPVELGFDQVKN
jgi:transcriptional antiterminator NusG